MQIKRITRLSSYRSIEVVFIISPSVDIKNPAISLKVTLLPEPFSPFIKVVVFRGISKDKFFDRLFASTITFVKLLQLSSQFHFI